MRQEPENPQRFPRLHQIPSKLSLKWRRQWSKKGVWQLIYMKLSETQESATGVIFCENCKVKDSKMCVGDFESNKRKKKSCHFCFFLEMDLNLPNRGSPLQSCSFIDHDGGSQDIKTIFLQPTSLQGT